MLQRDEEQEEVFDEEGGDQEEEIGKGEEQGAKQGNIGEEGALVPMAGI